MDVSFRSRLAGLLFKFRLLVAALFVSPTLVLAQEPVQPYAVIDRAAIDYRGPGRDSGHNLQGPEMKIGLLLPLQGPRKTEGDALARAVQMALHDENAVSLPDGRRLAVVTRDESGPWGRASSEIVHMVSDDQVLALITSADGGSAHLAEQVGTKMGVPILTLSTDPTTTQINLPWIFRLGTTDSTQAELFARHIYQDRRLRRVVLITENDHDGRVGGEEFEKAARDFVPGDSTGRGIERRGVESPISDPDTLAAEIAVSRPEALVVWTGPETAWKLIASVRHILPALPIYLCRKAATATEVSAPANIWIVDSRSRETAAQRSFQIRYREQFSLTPGLAAEQAYDAVLIITAALRRAGPNRARLRDALAEISNFQGVSGAVSFDGAGNNTSRARLVELKDLFGSAGL